MFLSISALAQLFSNRKSALKHDSRKRSLRVESLEERAVFSGTYYAVTDLRIGQLTTSSSPVAVSSALQNGANTTIIMGPRESPFYKVLQSESSAFGHQIGRREGNGWSVNVTDAPNRFMSFGPGTLDVRPGNRTATFTLQVDNVTAANHRILTVDVFDTDTGKVIAKRDIYRKDFSRPFENKDFNLNFKSVAGHRLEFRTYWHGGSYVQQDKVTIR